MVKNTMKLTLLSFASCTFFSTVLLVQGNPVIVPIETEKNSTFFWYPTENGLVPAFLEGGPPSTQASEADVKFYLYTLSNPDTKYELIIDDATNLADSSFIPNAPLKILGHGFGATADTGPGPSMKRQYFAGGFDYNVVFVEWGKLAASPWYDTAAANTKVAGEKTARLVNYLVSAGVTSYDLVHFLGHSLGAHVGGFMGSTIGAGIVGRITGLDPALPLFGAADDSGRIDPTDAAFVDIIHTAGGTLLEGGLAFMEERGHVDFYPNSGQHQPGCGLDAFGSCSHGRCVSYFSESVNNPNGFLACKCDSWEHFEDSCDCTDTANMVHEVDTSKRGRYYLRTNGESPYSQ